MKSVSNVPYLGKFLVLILTTATAAAEQCDFCNSRWRKVYEHDYRGAAISGSFNDLLNGAKQTQPIKYLIPSWGAEGYIGSSDSHYHRSDMIYFQSRSYVSKANWNTFEEEPYHRLLRLTTRGQIMETRYDVDNNTRIFTNYYRERMQWFLKESFCFSLVLEHSENGTVTNGTLDKLIASTASGHDVTEIWSNEFMAPFRNIKVTKDGNVVGQIIWDTEYGEHPNWAFVNVYPSGQAQKNSWLPGSPFLTHLNLSLPGKWYADSCWRRVFTNDQNGDGVDGSLSELISAVNHGHRVKVIMGNFSTEADNVRIKSGQVSAQLLNNLYDEEVDDKFRGIWHWQMAHTTGTVATRRYMLFNGGSVGEENEKKTIKWFVDTRPWTKVFSTNINGDVVFGSKAELRAAVENGADVRVAVEIGHSKPASNTPRKRHVAWWEMGGHGGWLWHRHEGSGGRHRSSYDCPKQVWTFFKISNLELGPSGEVSAEVLQSVSTEEVGSKEFKIKEEAYWKYMIITTQGDVDVSRRRVGKSVGDGHFSAKYAINWFVNY